MPPNLLCGLYPVATIMTSPIHLSDTSSSNSAKAAVLCDVCRKLVDLPTTQCGGACLHESPCESIKQFSSPIKYAGHFDCNICLDGCHDPVVTHCGHLFCWPCLYYWISLHPVSTECPVCKANVQDKIVPLYGGGKAEHSMHSAAMIFPKIHIPCRPSPNRSVVPVAANPVTDHDGERNHAIQDYEVHTIGAGHAASSASVGFFYGRDRNGASILGARRRFFNEKELVLHWAFIVGASIASVWLIVC